MTEINDLRERVEAAEERFGLIDEQQRHYSERLIGLIETIEAQLAAARSEIETQIAENLRLSQENEELRGMLHSVLRSIEQKTFTETLQNLESRVSALVGGAGVGGAEATQAGEDEPGDEIPAIDAMVDAEEAAAEAPDDPLIIETAPEETAEAGDGMAAEVDEMPDGGAEEAMTGEAVPDDASPAEETLAEESLAEGEEVVAEDGAAATGEAPPEASGPDDSVPDESAPETAMGDLAFEDDPQALAQDDAAAVEADAQMAGPELAEPELAGPEMAEPEMTGLETAGPEAAPTVKEIIRRVGDLARELEKAEAERKSSQGDAMPPTTGGESAEDLAPQSPAEDDDAPPLDRAVNG